jgi:hypothetical protein
MSILYKYFPLASEDHLDRVLRVLSGWIYFSSPLNFNDPFEMSPISAAPKADDFYEVMTSVGGKYNLLSKSAKDRFYQKVSAAISNSKPKITTSEWRNKLGVLCLTINPKDILMWAHYGSNHTGVCIGFNGNAKPFSSARAVVYTTQRPHVPVIDLSRDEQDIVSKVLMTKSEHWKYECERRVIKRPINEHEREYYRQLINDDPSNMNDVADLLASEGGPGIYQFESQDIQRIYFGARISANHKQRIGEICAQLERTPKVFEIELDPSHYWLNDRRNRTYGR